MMDQAKKPGTWRGIQIQYLGWVILQELAFHIVDHMGVKFGGEALGP